MQTHKLSVSLLTAGIAAAAVTVFTIVARRRRLQARRYAAIAARLDRFAGIEDDLEPDPLDSEDLQWRPRTGSSLAGPEDLEEPFELDFEEFDDTDVASAAVTIDMIGDDVNEPVSADAGRGGGERAKPKSQPHAALGQNRRSTTQRSIDDWLDELDDPTQPPHRYR